MQNMKKKKKRIAACIFDESNNVLMFKYNRFLDTHVEVFERYHLDFMKKINSV